MDKVNQYGARSYERAPYELYIWCIDEGEMTMVDSS